MKIVYYTSASFMDSALETLQLIKRHHEVHLLIEVTEFSKNATVIQIDSLQEKRLISRPEEILSKEQLSFFLPYFEGLSNVHFIVHKNKRGFSPVSMLNALRVGRFMRKSGYDVIHLDNISQRLLALAPWLRKRKMVVTLHDPMPHSGEESWKINVRNKYFVGSAASFVFYSEYSKRLFIESHPDVKAPSYSILLQPCSFVRNFISKYPRSNQSVLFWGRLSKYKGIDILMEAIPVILKKFPSQHFIIAGKPTADFKIDQQFMEDYRANISFIPEYLSMEKVVQLIQQSKFIVCPYRDATQSGVLTTAFALGKTAVVSNAGSFEEYITDDFNGLIALPDPISLADKIILALENNYYLQLEANVKQKYDEIQLTALTSTIDQAYKAAADK